MPAAESSTSELLAYNAVQLEPSSARSSDEELFLQVGDGSRDALSQLFRRHAPVVLNVARRILRDDAEAEDLVQEVFLFVFQKAGLFDPAKGTAVSWLMQTTYYRAIDRRRRLNVRFHYTAQPFEEELVPPAGTQTVIDHLAAKSLLEKMRRDLPPEQRQTLELHFFEGYTFHEIAEITGRNFGTVRHHFYRGLERLRSEVFGTRSQPK